MSGIIRIEPPAGCRVRFISDLHLGHERCECPPPELMLPLLQDVDMLVVLGDLAESRNCAWRERGVALRKQFRTLCQQQGVELLEISGNHDPDVEPLLAFFWGGRVAAMHGHALYKEVAPWSWEYINNKKEAQRMIAGSPEADKHLEDRLELSRRMCGICKPIMRREGIGNPLLRSFLHCFWPPQRPLRIVLSWLLCGRRAKRFAEQFMPQAEYIVLGHFHRSGHWRYPNCQVYNTGAWFKHATPYVLDMRDGKILFYGPASAVLRKNG